MKEAFERRKEELKPYNNGTYTGPMLTPDEKVRVEEFMKPINEGWEQEKKFREQDKQFE